MDERPTTQPLTPAEILALPDGARVVVEWDGGNGPWEYVFVRCAHNPPGYFAMQAVLSGVVGWPEEARNVWLAED